MKTKSCLAQRYSLLCEIQFSRQVLNFRRNTLLGEEVTQSVYTVDDLGNVFPIIDVSELEQEEVRQAGWRRGEQKRAKRE